MTALPRPKFADGAPTAGHRDWQPRWRTLGDDLAIGQDNFLLLRFLAAAMVIYGHGPAITGGNGPPDLFGWLGWGRYSGSIAVDLFFLVSGFLVAGSFLRRGDVVEFIWARALRIVPAYAVCVAGCAFVLGTLLTTLPLGDYLAAPATRGYVLTNLGFDNVQWQLPGVFGTNPHHDAVNGSLWTLPAEVRMYVGLAFLGVFGVLQRRWLCNVALAALFVFGLVAPDHLPLVMRHEYVGFAGMFALGTFCYVNRSVLPRHGGLVVATALLAWLLHSTPLYPFAFALGEAAFAFWFAYGLPWHGFNQVGDYSYGIYLWGYPMQQLVAHAAPTLTPLSNSAFGFVLALSLAFTSWHLVEKPALTFKRLPQLLRERLHALMLPWQTRRQTSSSLALRPSGVPPIVARWFRAGVLSALVFISLIWLWTSLAAIANFAFRYPAFDQFRLYRLYLGLPFPASAIQLENGHRPILPALIRLAEIRWAAAGQSAQIIVGCTALLLALGAIVMTIARETTASATSRAAACLLAILALLWLGNARILMHGNELVHVYFVILFSVLAILAIHRACTHDAVSWSGLAALCCIGATFSFGTGIASFVALFLVAFVLGARKRLYVLPLALLVATLVVYAFGLPGAGAVLNSPSIDPLGNALQTLRWLSAPWMHAWLGYADPPLEPSVAASPVFQHGLGRGLATSAQGITALFGDNGLMREGCCVGALGLLAYVIFVIHGFRKRSALSRSGALALGLATFALAIGALVCLNRAQAFDASPSQVFADRYLPWSCLFWFGLALYVCAGHAARSRWHGPACALAALACAAILLPSNRALGGWSATVHRNIQQSAVAAQLGIWDPLRFPDNADARRADVLDTLDRLQRAHLSMFAEPAFELVQSGWHAPQDLPTTLAGSTAHVVREFDDMLGQRRVAAFEGWLPRIEGVRRNATLVVVDAHGVLRGLAKPSFIGPNKHVLRFGIAQKRGFDGYVLAPQRGERLRVLVLDASATRVLATIALDVPDLDNPS